MKHFFGVVFALAIVSMSLTANSQVVYPFNADGEAELSEVVECSLPKEIVYKNALDLAAKKSGKIILRDDDNYKITFACSYSHKPEWKIVYTGIMGPDVKTRILSDDINYQVTIECKDGRYRIKVNNISFTYKTRYEVTKDIKYYTRPVTKENLQNYNFEEAQKNLEWIEKKDTSQMKKKEIEKHTTDLELAREAFEYFKNLNQTEYEILLGQISHAKEKLATNDDF